MPRSRARTRCSIARSLELLGEKWTLLIIREAFSGQTRFVQFRDRLGIAPDVLADRLATLVEFAVLERRPYRVDGDREREEYVLTPAGKDVVPILAALNEWGDRYRAVPGGSAASFVTSATCSPVTLRFVDAAGAGVASEEVSMIRRDEPAD